MTAVAHMTNEIRQMLYNFGYKTRCDKALEGGYICTLTQVEGSREVSGKVHSTQFEAIVQAYIALLRKLNPEQKPSVEDVEGPKEKDAATPLVTDQLADVLRKEGYEVALEPDKSGYGWRGALFQNGQQIVYTDYAATKFDALTHAMGFLIEYLEQLLEAIPAEH